MRSHAKAATAGPTNGPGNAPGLIRGAFATQGDSLRVDGSGARLVRGLALSSVLYAAVLVLLCTGTAAAAQPTVPLTSVSAVTTKTAVLEADINPEGEPTTYQFEYGPTDCSANACTSVPVPAGNVGAGSSPVRIKKEIAGLTPGTTYHYRVIATNGSGVAVGPDRTFATYASPTTTGCPNEAFRGGISKSLPNCRAYEMVSPVEKNNGDVQSRLGVTQGHTSTAGGKITYGALTAFDDPASAPLISQYMAIRGPNGWSTEAISAPQKDFVVVGGIVPLWPFYKMFTDDLSKSVLLHLSEPLTPDGIEGWASLYRRNNENDSYEPLITVPPTHYPPPEHSNFWPEPQGMSADGSHIVFRAPESLTPGAPFNGEQDNIFEWVNGELRLVSVLPDDTPFIGAGKVSVGTAEDQVRTGGRHSTDNAVSEDGSRIFWSASDEFFNPGKLYVRIDGTSTVAVSESVSNEPARFWTASADGSTAVFTIGSDGDLGAEGIDLYEFDVDTETPTLIAPKVKGVAGAADDLSHIYFVSTAVLDAGATDGEANLYVRRGGAIVFIGTLMDDEGLGISNGQSPPSVVKAIPAERQAMVTGDGRHIVFASRRSLTDYDNTGVDLGQPVKEIYRYAAESRELTCVSCNPSGTRPMAEQQEGPGEIYEAASIPTWVGSYSYQPRSLTEDGSRVFFNSVDALLPQDTNGAQDVYQWEAQGSGSCTRNGGCVSLLSSGKSPRKSELVDASATGEDVFIATNSSLLPQDPGLTDIYDARENGGYPPPPAPPTPCLGDACQNVPPPPNDPTPASTTFRGAGDPPARRQRRVCRARSHKSGKARKSKGGRAKESKGRQAKRCRRTGRRAGR